MIPFRTDSLIENNVEYVPALRKQFAESYYSIDPKSNEDSASEKSYEPTYGIEGFFASFVFLSFDAMWSLIAAITTTFIYTLISYRQFFDADVITDHSFVMLVYFTSCCINLIDVVSSAMHYYSAEMRELEVYPKKSKILIMIDYVSIIATIIDLGLYILRPGNTFLTIVVLVIVTLREYRMFQYFRTITRSPQCQDLGHVLIKYMLLTFVFNHTAACVWKLLACFGCDDGIGHWNRDIDPKTRPSVLYIFSLFNALDSTANMGLIGASSNNYLEFTLTFFLILYGMILNTGVFLGTFTEVQIDSNKRKALYKTKLHLVQKELSNKYISKKLRKNVGTWYVNFWVKEHAVIKCSLEKHLPITFQRDIKFDKYFIALNNSHYTRHLHNEVKIALSMRMYTTHYNRGDIILKQNKTQKGMIYVAKGVVQLVSPDDFDSPIIMFEYGTSIGGPSMQYAIPVAAHLVATTYCHVHILNKEDFWRTMAQCYKLKPCTPVFETNSFIMHNARQRQFDKLRTKKRKHADKTLKLVKNILKKKERCEITGIVSENNLLGVYQISKGVEVITHRDDNFLSSKFPWILYENSHFYIVWDYVVFVIATVVIATYPYYLFYISTPPTIYYSLLRPVAYAAFAIDVVIQLCTSTLDEHQQLISSFSEIMTYRFGKLMFLIDVWSITPIEFISLMRGAQLTEQMAYIECNHMLKVFRVFKKLVNITHGVRLKGRAMRIVFYVICLIYFGYLQGIIYYKVACPCRPCKANTWVRIHIDYISQHDIRITDSDDFYILLVAIYDGMQLLTGAAGVFLSTSIGERIVLGIFCLSYMYLFTYLLADYSAILTMDGYLQSHFRADVKNLNKFMHSVNMDKTIIFRMNTYMETIYSQSSGKVLPMFLEDAPAVFQDKINMEKTRPFVAQLPLFQKFSEASMRRLLAKVKYEIYPANEYVAYAGDRSYNMYVIQQGYCEISRAGLKIKTMLGPFDNHGILEMILKFPLLHNIKTLTNVKLIYFSNDDFQEIFNSDAELKRIVKYAQLYGTSISISRMFNISQSKVQRDFSDTQRQESSFITFKGGKLDDNTIDLHKGWLGYSMISFLFLKMTIHPNAAFIYRYVLFHSMVAFMSSILYPFLFILECIVPNYAILLLSLPWDVLCMIDVYLRLHVCYYNSNGLLVSHPRKTACNYLKNSFVVDFFTALPLKLLLDSMFSKKISACIVLLKVIRAYRIPNGFDYFQRNVLKNPPTYLLIVHYLTISLVFWHTMTLGLVLISVDLGVDSEGHSWIHPKNNSWFYTKINSEITFEQSVLAAPLRIYLLALYCITSFSLQITLADVIMIQRIELVYIILTIISGYIWFTYILVIIANSKMEYNDNVTMYMNNLRDLLRFMDKKHISKMVKRKNIRHFEYIFQRNQGYRNHAMFTEFHLTLRRDCQWELHAPSLLNVPIFKDLDLTFFQKLCAEIHIVYYLEHSNILCVNDVINMVYIICRGGIQVFSPSGSRVAVLGQGAIFGNLDCVHYTRCMLQYTTATTTDVLCLQTSQFYKVLQEYPNGLNALKSQLSANNLNYVSSKITQEIQTIKVYKHSNCNKFLMSTWCKFIFMIISFFSYQLAIFNVAFQQNTPLLYTISYILDFLHVVKIFLIFQTPYINNVGELITSKKLISKRALKMPSIYVDFLALLPLEVFALACSESFIAVHGYNSIFRLNRLLRILNIQWSHKVIHDYRRLNTVISSVYPLFISSATYLNLIASVWFIVSCPSATCPPNSWIFDEKTNQSNCKTPYLCSLYYVTSLASTAGFNTFVPRKVIEILMATIILVLSRFVSTLLIASMASLVRHFGFRLQQFSEQVQIMKIYFRNANISPHLTSNILKYIERLWLRSYGKQMPDFLDAGPSVLVEEIKVFAFGSHIFGNLVFRDCHNDFLRLLTAHTKLVRHFTGDVICNQGEINDTMYFIHWGQVEVLCISDKLEVQVDLLSQLDCFGMIQGLFPNTPHSHTYKAKGTSEIITLCLSDWIQILAFYPAAKFHIYKAIRDKHSLIEHIRRA